MSTLEKFVQPAIPRFDGHYDFWSMTMENFMLSKELWQLVKDGILMFGATPTEAQRKSAIEVNLKDMKVKNYLFKAIDREILETILDKSTSHAIWRSIQQKYQGSTRVKCAQLQALRWEFEFLTMKDGEKIDSYIGRTLSVVNKMKVNGETLDSSTVVSKILRSLTSNFNYVVFSIEEANDLSTLSLDKLHGSLLVHEQRMQSFQLDEHVLKVTHDGRLGASRGRSRGMEKQAHYATFEDAAETENEILLVTYEEMTQSFQREDWFLDYGCSNHMTGNKQWFREIHEEWLNKNVKLGNDTTLNVAARGSIRVQINDVTYVISDVYYVPKLKTNLLSLGQLQEKGLTILLQNDTYQKRSKLDAKRKQYILLGVSDETKAYKIYDPITKKVIVRRDVVFEEDKSWNWDAHVDGGTTLALDWGDKDGEKIETVKFISQQITASHDQPVTLEPTLDSVPTDSPVKGRATRTRR
ncbi:uncharacterized protein LOC120175865 [Hibiscus syriacus]|uniref:uncharacterized protein LOC120175865 n=1 Tax=Hibiscus syriacus TaxID=106335 RepID=UPI001922DC05|nr:uncharacterized protein LOC120175865 [Hibiscus syriacus]